MTRRLLAGTLLGMVAAAVCFAGGALVAPLIGLSITGLNATTLGLVGKLLNRVLIGTVIGATTLDAGPVARGGGLGLVVGIGWLPTFEPGALVYVVWLATSIIYGVGIDWALTRSLGARAIRAAPTPANG